MPDAVKRKKVKAPRRHGAEVVKEGSLYKLGSRVMLWRTRYFVVRGGVLEYYVDQLSWLESRAPKGSLPLLGAKLTYTTESTLGKQNCLALIVTSNPDRTYTVAAESAEEQMEWYEILTQTIEAARRKQQDEFDYQVTKSFARDEAPEESRNFKLTEDPAEKPVRVWLERSVSGSVDGHKMGSVVASMSTDISPFLPGGRPRVRSATSEVSVSSESSEIDPYGEWDVHNQGKHRGGAVKYKAEKPSEPDKESGVCSCAVS